MRMNIQTLKGFRDFLPKEAKKRQYVINTLKSVFESYGFEPLETPALEYEEILLGKYGEEGDKLMYRFEDNGKRRVALRYDQTVPLARVAAQYSNQLPMPFKRYQMQPVWRAENTQKGRFREFLQCDADIVGASSTLSDAEIVMVAIKALEALGFVTFKLLINDRENLQFSVGGITLSQDRNINAVRAIDKLKKIGRATVLQELEQNGFSKTEAQDIMQIVEKTKPTPRLQEVFASLATTGVSKKFYEFSPTLARGLDYYTGIIIEAEIDGYEAGSVLGGGRYDKLIGMFSRSASSGQADIPAVGFAFGFDRLMDAMQQFNLFPKELSGTSVLVTIFSKDLQQESLEIASQLRADGISTELYLDPTAKMEKQLKYANQKQIRYVIIVGPEEAAKNVVTIKNMMTREQQQLPLESVKEIVVV